MRRVDTSQRYWFAAMRHGYGWGLPRTWEGWLVLAAYLACVLAPAVLLSERREVGILAAVVVATPVLVWICFLKGEPPGGPGQQTSRSTRIRP
jgi:hypothetical protein